MLLDSRRCQQMTDPDPRTFTPLSEWETGGDHNPATLVDHVDDAAGEWSVRSVMVSGETDDGSLVLLVLRQRVRDVGLLFRFGYCYADLDDPDDPVSGWSDNYIDMRADGGLTNGLLRLFAAVDQGGATPDDPLLLDARDGSAETDPEMLTHGLGEPQPEQDDRADDLEDDRDDRDPSQSIEQDDQPETVQCDRCGERIAREQAENFGSFGVGGDVWVCSEGCE